MRFGTVQSLDRPNQVANVILDGMNTPAPCSYLSKRGKPNCWPLSRVLVDGAMGALRVIGAAGDRRMLFVDDFLDTSFVTGGVHVNGDTPWGITYGAGNTNFALQVTQGGPLSDSVGVGALVGTGSGSANTFRAGKDFCYLGTDTPQALWISARAAVTVTVPTSGNGLNYWPITLNPLGSSGLTAYVAAESVIDTDNQAKWQLITSFGVATSVVVHPRVITLGTWSWFDLMITNQWIALWVDAAFVSQTSSASFPVGTGTLIGPGFRIDVGGATSGTLNLDYYDAALVTPAVDPSTLPLPGRGISLAA